MFGLMIPILRLDWTAPWIYSILYNSSVIIPETLILIIITPPIIKRLNHNPVTLNPA
jgi:thiamine transporter ThiT